MKHLINIYFNDNLKSIETFLKTKKLLEQKGFEVCTDFNKKAELNICIGGDGSFIRGVHGSDFSSIPFVGVNTGTLGFFQEINFEHIEKFIDDYINKKYFVEKMRLLECEMRTKDIVFSDKCLNEFVIKSNNSEIIHLEIYIDGNLLETFAGDGLIISTPSGSTAYNMSAGGSIMYPTLKGYQLTPLAPIFSKVYRSISNSIVIPNTSVLKIVPIEDSHKKISFIKDGIENEYKDISYFEFKKSKTMLYKLIFNENWYWINMRDKFL
ncbi:MAG: NAD(+)/NADH kinase [Peptoniphilaceae bacterium]|uniref:NAD(+)/NADH kinase n=1 Tax=Parvimonas sp. TaxID=1944660 RepID=UPI002A75E4D6|nr:NAD(+)/NADH kinase [Parvimonas sp.]MDD7765453.1 NAD(+)/NADH kinase [Peptoniphilaceae bacterium]MDY3050994.1 NAD(+)/NADH kinase [Parvimonas sp.]